MCSIKILSFFLLLTFISCNKAPKPDDAANKDVAQSSDAQEKNPEMILIDKESERIPLVPTNSYDFCDAKQKIESLTKLANSETAINYVKKKQDEMMEILRRYRDEITEKESEEYINDNEINQYSDREINKMKSDNWKIIGAKLINKVDNTENGVRTKILTIFIDFEEERGLFKQNNIIRYDLVIKATYTLKCKSDDRVKMTSSWRLVYKKPK